MEDSRSSGDDNSRDMIPPPLTAKEDSGSDGDSPPSRPILMDVPGTEAHFNTLFAIRVFAPHWLLPLCMANLGLATGRVDIDSGLVFGDPLHLKIRSVMCIGAEEN